MASHGQLGLMRAQLSATLGQVRSARSALRCAWPRDARALGGRVGSGMSPWRHGQVVPRLGFRCRYAGGAVWCSGVVWCSISRCVEGYGSRGALRSGALALALVLACIGCGRTGVRSLHKAHAATGMRKEWEPSREIVYKLVADDKSTRGVRLVAPPGARRGHGSRRRT